MRNPKFSIAIPAYKSRFLSETIESCLNQTYSDFEIVIVDDASPEDLYQIVQKYPDERIRYYRNERNCGAINVVDNWNICLSYCFGEYIICMGDDDCILPCCLEEYDRLINKYPLLDVYHAWTEIIDDCGIVTRQLLHRPEYQGCMSMIWNNWSGDAQYIGDFCFRIEQLRSVGGFFKLPLAWGADHITTIRAAAKEGIANTQKIAFQYRENAETISRSQCNAIKIEAKLIEKRWFEHFLEHAVPIDDTADRQSYKLLKEHHEEYFQREILLYIKKYFHESLLHIFHVLWKYRHYEIALTPLLLLYLRVVKYKIKMVLF